MRILTSFVTSLQTWFQFCNLLHTYNVLRAATHNQSLSADDVRRLSFWWPTRSGNNVSDTRPDTVGWQNNKNDDHQCRPTMTGCVSQPSAISSHLFRFFYCIITQLLADLENLFSNAHLHDEYFCQVFCFIQISPLRTDRSRRAKQALTDCRLT